MLRKIIQINEEKCDGCGACVPECHEGALQIIDGKARLISDLFCDGLGACLGYCPTGALTVVEREANPYDEKLVMDYIVKGGVNVIKAHLQHLKDHKEFEYLTEALDYLNDRNITIPQLDSIDEGHEVPHACPGSQSITIAGKESDYESGERISHLRQWPIQLHLVSAQAAYFRESDFLLAADCCGFVYPDFHKDFLKGRSLAIACPKLDSNKQVYLDKIISLINDVKLKSITVLIMTVPCCGGLAQLVQQAVQISGTNIPVNLTIINPAGEVTQTIDLN